ncbi:hypothetical protein E8A74_03315 [Polyangium fumosum]|uniref:Uncharacterized protein n=2 Tax=Polyangium fumosum TaxID=889272 RepID=A0A4U1JJB8_9BACT|nr:hypothetical protein E8A74_03315 [Polyangium fumosum]
MDGMQPVSQPAKKPAGKVMVTLGVVLFFALVLSSCVGKHLWTVSAPPITRTVELLEKDPAVAAALGSPVSVSMAVTKTLRRDFIRAMQGQDNVTVLAKASGPKGEAWFRLSAQNHDGQGWAGTFSVTTEGRQVLEGGSYKAEGAGTLIEGDFARDGTPRVKKR